MTITEIRVERETLTDGSHVFNVKIGDTLLAAYDKDNADDLAHSFADAIEAHAVTEVQVFDSSWIEL